jgi:peptide/nickel transport system permease protein
MFTSQESSVLVQSSAAAAQAGARRRRGRRLPFKRYLLACLGAGFLGLLVLLALVEPLLPLPGPNEMDLLNILAPPSLEHPLGTDENGRDLFVRLIHGGRISLLVGLSGAALTVLIGTLVGLSAGYYGGVIDQLLMRITDGMLSIPLFFLILAVVAIFGSAGGVLVLTLALTRWMGVARLVRAEVLRHREMDYVLAAHSLGIPARRVMTAHLLPAAVPTIIVSSSLAVGEILLVEAGLSFLGLGILPPTPSWGNMLSNSQYYIWSAPHLAIYPGVMIALSVLACNAIGDVLRDLLDPRMRGRE